VFERHQLRLEEEDFQNLDFLVDMVTSIHFEVGVLLPSAVLSSGTKTFASGKYEQRFPLGIS
jgi:hypothetical protein